MATTPVIGGNRAYYIPALFGANAGAGSAGTPALTGATSLNDLLASLLANFNPSIGSQNIPMGMTADGGYDSSAGGTGAVAKNGGNQVSPLEALGTLGTVANVASTVGPIGAILGIPDIGPIANAVGTITNAGQAYYGDAARDQIASQINADLEAAGLEGNVDLGRYGYDPSLAAASKVASGMGTLAGAPIIGNAIGQGLMMAADPVPSTPGDLVRAGVDTIVPGLINAAVKGATGYTIGENIKGGMTPVAETIARTPEEIARDEALGGRTAEGAPVETIVPTPVGDIPPQDEATFNAVIDAIAAASEPAPNLVGAMGVETLANDLNFADTQSVRGPVLDTEPEPVAPPAASEIFNFFGLDFSKLGDFAKAFSIPLSIGGFGGVSSNAAAEPAVPPPAPPVAEPPPAPTGADTSPETMNAIFEQLAQYQQMMETESSIGSSPSTEATDYSGLSDFEMSYT